MIIPQGRVFRALNSTLDYSIIISVKGGAVKVKRKLVIAGVRECHSGTTVFTRSSGNLSYIMIDRERELWFEGEKLAVS
jgi:hypothetical protein